MNEINWIKILVPYLVFYYSFVAYVVIQWKKHGVKNLTPIIWLLIILLFQLVGPIAYLIVGRGNRDQM